MENGSWPRRPARPWSVRESGAFFRPSQGAGAPAGALGGADDPELPPRLSDRDRPSE
jgi:hypothetical protein